MTSATLNRPIDAVDIPLTFTANQVSELAKVPLSKVYSIRKTELRAGHHYTETLNSNNCKCFGFKPSSVSAIELAYWLKVGVAQNWTEQRLDAFRRASEWLAEVEA